MKDLRNISGILPAQFRTNPNDCGIAWSEHRSQRPAGHRKTGIKLHVYCDSEAIDSVYEKAVSAIEGFKKAITETLKPIDPQTIKVGDTVRLVGSRTITEWPGSILEAGKDYKVSEVNNKDNKTLNVRVACHFKGGFWVYGEDLVLVESTHGEQS